MVPTIDQHTLQQWLEKGQPVTLLDVQPENAYAEWHIPGSVHINRYEALKVGDPQALEKLDLPRDRPVVTICPRGKTSALAAEQLRRVATTFGTSLAASKLGAWPGIPPRRPYQIRLRP